MQTLPNEAATAQATASPALVQTFRLVTLPTPGAPRLPPPPHQHQHRQERPASSRAEVKSTARPEGPHVPWLPSNPTCCGSHLDHLTPASPAWVIVTHRFPSRFISLHLIFHCLDCPSSKAPKYPSSQPSHVHLKVSSSERLNLI